MAATLTERYISAVTKSLNPTAQDDVRMELEASIADAVEARTDQGEAQTDAERTVLTDLGDPAILAAGYADRPLHLIGPKYFLTWWRLLKLLLWILPVTAVAGVTIANVVLDRPIGEIIGQVFAVGISTFVHVAFWTTLVFFILDRSGAESGVEWTIDSLPEPQEDGAGRGDLIATLVFLGLTVAAVLWDRLVGFVFVADGGVDISEGLGGQTTGIPILHPDLWPWWLGSALILMGIEAVLAIAVYAGRGWRPRLAISNTALAVVFAAGSIYLLATRQLLNPAFLEFALGRGDVPVDLGHILAVVLGVVIVGVAAWDIVDGWLKTRRAKHQA